MNPWRVATGLLMILAALGGCGWLLWRSIKKSEDPARLAFRWILTVGLVGGGYFGVYKLTEDDSGGGKAAGLMLGLVLGLVLAIMWAPVIGAKVGEWFGNLYTGGSAPPDPVPLYSVAESRRKQGRFHEAVWEIQGQLAKFPEDVVGQMMLAEILAGNLNDLPGAQLTIERFCAQPGHGPKNIAFALNSLADWHLKYNRDVEAARAAVQKIIDLTPDTEVAMVAAQRLAHLADADAMAAVLERKPIQMHAAVENLGLRQDSASMQRKEDSPEEAADRLVKQLEAHPLDAESREKLARIYSGDFGRLDLAVDQLEQLINAPHQPGKDVARWLNTVADMQVTHGADYDAVHATLQRIITTFPGLAAGRLAQQRIEHLRLELKGKEQGHSLKLGSYEKDLGLKHNKPSTDKPS